jgi:hypothetical protein
VSLDSEHEERVQLIEGVEDAEEIAGMAVGGYGEDVTERRRKKCG